MEEYEKPTQYAYHALLDVDSAHFSRAPRNSSRLWTQDFMMNIESLVIQKGIYIYFLRLVYLSYGFVPSFLTAYQEFHASIIVFITEIV